jgi:hypothetical protein
LIWLQNEMSQSQDLVWLYVMWMGVGSIVSPYFFSWSAPVTVNKNVYSHVHSSSSGFSCYKLRELLHTIQYIRTMHLFLACLGCYTWTILCTVVAPKLSNDWSPQSVNMDQNYLEFDKVTVVAPPVLTGTTCVLSRLASHIMIIIVVHTTLLTINIARLYLQ